MPDTPHTLIRVVDIETTGLDLADDAIVEIGWCDLRAHQIDLAGAPANWRVADALTGHPQSRLVDPRRPIPPQSSAVHHIIDRDVVGCPTAADVVSLLCGDDAGPAAIFAAHNAKFERGFLDPLMPDGRLWLCSYKLALRLWPDAPSHANAALRYWRGLEAIDRDRMRPTHRAGPDAYVTATLLAEMLNDPEYPPLATLLEWSQQPALQVTCHIGAWRGHKWTEVDEGFLRWVAARDFDEDVLYTVRHELERRQSESEALHSENGSIEEG